MHAIIESIDTVSKYATPIDDLLLCAAVQLTFNLQAVGQSLQPFFEMIGITEPVKVLNIGMSSVEDDDREDSVLLRRKRSSMPFTMTLLLSN